VKSATKKDNKKEELSIEYILVPIPAIEVEQKLNLCFDILFEQVMNSTGENAYHIKDLS
jgi:hypothetical protein